MHIISGNAEEHRGDLHSPGVEGAPPPTSGYSSFPSTLSSSIIEAHSSGGLANTRCQKVS